MVRQTVFKLTDDEFEEIEAKRGKLSRSFYIREKVFNSELDEEKKKIFKHIFDEMWDNLSIQKQKKLTNNFLDEIKQIQEVLS